MPSSKWLLAIAATAALCTPGLVVVALAGDGPAPAVGDPLKAPLAGHSSVGAHMRATAHRRLEREHAHLGSKVEAAGGARWRPADALRARRASLSELRIGIARLRSQLRALDAPVSPVLAAIAECESHGNPRAVGGGGAYRGLFQFTLQTWSSVGGSGDPAAASRTEQFRRAAILLARGGRSQWPGCSG